MNGRSSTRSVRACHTPPIATPMRVMAMLYATRQRRAVVRNSAVFAGVAALVVLLGLPAKAYETQSMYGNDEGQVEFTMPSGNIGCVYTPAGGTSFYETS